MMTQSERYVRLALALGVHDPGYVDAFSGPPEWRGEEESARTPLDRIRDEALELAAGILVESARRRAFLVQQLQSMAARASMLLGAKMSFDQESEALYGAVAPRESDAAIGARVRQLDSLLPGKGNIGDRYRAYVSGFQVRGQALETVIARVMAEARSRTRRFVTLPPDERCDVVYSTGKPWGAYHWFFGRAMSMVEFNTSMPIDLGRALILASHEAYPGHHTMFCRLDRDLYHVRGWVEFCVTPYHSPMMMVAEGAADYGVLLAFPPSQRVEYFRSVLFPLAGFDAAEAERFAAVKTLFEDITNSAIQAARRYLDGEMSAAQCRDWLIEYSLSAPASADRRVQFMDLNRAFVINYGVRDLVAAYMTRQNAGLDRGDAAWPAYVQLISRPPLASDLTSPN